VKQLSHGSSNSPTNTKLALLPAMSQEEDAKLQEEFKEGSSSIPDGIIDFLLQNSPSAKVHYWKGEIFYFDFCLIVSLCFFNYNLLTFIMTCKTSMN
jgi:hypothetical protein